MTQRASVPDWLISPRGWIGLFVFVVFQIVISTMNWLISFAVGTSPLQQGLLLLSAVSALVIGWLFNRLRQQTKPLVLLPQVQQPPKHRGLILLVGTGRPGAELKDQAELVAIQYHLAAQGSGLQHCWLIASEGEKGSLPFAQQLEERCKAWNVQAKIVKPVDFLSVQDSYDRVQQVYAEEIAKVGLSEQDVIADWTGGTKPMSAGMILACGNHRKMQYVQGRTTGLIIASIPMLIEFVPQNQGY